MNIETVFKQLFPDHQYSGDDEALVQIRAEVEVMREQLGVRIADMRRMFAQFVQTNPAADLADVLFLSRDLAERNAFICSRGKLPAARGEGEIQKAHDILTQLIDDPTMREKIYGDVDPLELIKANADVLCWILGHKHNDTFAKNLADIEAALFQLGYVAKTIT